MDLTKNVRMNIPYDAIHSKIHGQPMDSNNMDSILQSMAQNMQCFNTQHTRGARAEGQSFMEVDQLVSYEHDVQYDDIPSSGNPVNCSPGHEWANAFISEDHTLNHNGHESMHDISTHGFTANCSSTHGSTTSHSANDGQCMHVTSGGDVVNCSPAPNPTSAGVLQNQSHLPLNNTRLHHSANPHDSRYRSWSTNAAVSQAQSPITLNNRSGYFPPSNKG
eukprot:971358_1